MNEQQDYFQDIAQIRSIMERSSKFLSLAGWAGIMAGLYALVGAYVAYTVFEFNPDELMYGSAKLTKAPSNLLKVIALAILVLILAIGTAVLLSSNKAAKRGEKLWNALISDY